MTLAHEGLAIAHSGFSLVWNKRNHCLQGSDVPKRHLEDYLTTASVLTSKEKMLCAHISIHYHNQILIPFQNFKWCCILLGILVIILAGLISRRR